jgi:hypothetical protein
MSALPPKVDMSSATRDVCYGPKADIANQVSGLFAFENENAINVIGSLPMRIDGVRPVRDEAAISNVGTERVGCRQSVPGCQRDDQVAVIARQRGCDHDQAAIRSAYKFGNSVLDVFGVRVACCNAATAGVELARMTSGDNATNSIAVFRKSPASHRYSICKLRPTVQPNFCIS